jgi:hypothetical protein
MKRVVSVLMSIVVVLSCVVFIMPPNIVLAANYTWPLKTSINISREFTGSNCKTQHTGCDFSCSLGNDVYAIADGTVVTATDYGCTGSHYGGTPACSKGSSCPAAKASSDGKGSYANRICIDHGNGVYSFYAHLSTGTFKVKSGDRARQGQLIAKTGTSGKSTGPHLHFEIRVGGNSTNYAKNPRNYLTKVNPVPNTVTTTPSIWKNSDSYTVGNSATLTWNSVDNATGYWLSVWYKGEQIVTTQVSGSSEYTLNNLGEGEYTAYITAYNDSSSKQGSVTFRVNYVSGEQTIPNGRYQICSALDNSSVISISGASTDDEANVLLYANERHDNQYFDFEYLGNGYYKITAKHSGKVLDVYWEKMEVGANVQQYYWNNGDNQQWVVKDAGDGYFYIISKSNSLYMDVYGGVASNDVNIDTYTGHGGTSEKWKLIPAGEQSVADGKYQICTVLDDSSVISISEASKDACANALLYANENHKNQVFNFEYQGDGYYKIIARHSGMALDVYNSEQSSGANVEQYPWKNSDNQKWVVKPAGDGYYYIVSKCNGLYLDVYGGVAVNDANIDTYFGHGGASEKWRLIPVNEPENLLTVKGCSVSLKENIGVNMYASFSDDILEDDGAKVRFTYADNSYIEVPLSNYMSTTYNNENVKKITFDTVPAKLTEKIKVSVIKSDDTQTNMFSFSTSDYLYALINSTDKSIDANQKNIAKALLNYGAYSQIYFGVDTADLANKKLTDNTVEKTDSDTVIKSIQGQENGLFSNKDFEYIGSSLVCDSSTDLKLYFVNKSRLTMKQIENQYDISVANKNTHGFDVGTDGNILWIKVKDLRPNELEEMYSVRILSDDGSVIVEISPSVYIKKALLSEDVKLENLSKAMWMYGQAVKDYGK